MSDNSNIDKNKKPKKNGKDNKPKKEPTGDYDVGYCRPPESGRFKDGQVANPKGRPSAKPRSFETDVKDILNTIMEVRSNGKIIKATKRKVFLEQIINLAIKGNPTMARLALPLLKIADETPEFEILPEDKAILENIMKNLGYDEENDEEI